MKNLIIINEPIYKSLIDEFISIFRPFGLVPSSISPSYGLAENCTFVSTSWRSGNDNIFPTHKNLLPSAKLPSCNEVLMSEEDIHILIVNEETHEPVDDGIEGEIWISSPSNASGYLDHSALTQEAFNARLRNRVAGCFVRTGDRGVVMGEQRYLYVMGRSSDILKRADGTHIHPHYLETAAYNSSPKMVRAGCVAAFELSGAIAVMAELQKHDVDAKGFIQTCEGIRNMIWIEERVEVWVVILVKSRSVPKTTSGKVQRWAAKCGVERGQMREVVRVEFGSDSKKFVRVGNVERERKKVDISEEREGIYLEAGNNGGNRLSLLSSL